MNIPEITIITTITIIALIKVIQLSIYIYSRITDLNVKYRINNETFNQMLIRLRK